VSKKRKERRRNTPDNAYSEGIIEAQIHGFDVPEDTKAGRKDDKRDYKITKMAQKTELVKAKGTRLKWLVILIGLIMAGFGAFKSGLFGG
jgi:hypothetical protein|tara:strand:- start:11128 stop:11397 length:270 start_codon:yes stop_codon:yes gene_type:complete